MVHPKHWSIKPWSTFNETRATGIYAQVNPEGLTWGEWAHAAAVPFRGDDQDFRSYVDTRRSKLYGRYFRAWKQGEDPTEWKGH